MAVNWTEKYRPQSLSDIVGNPTAVRVMRDWARSWTSGMPEKKALILIGPPGTGKTSAALALANDFHWSVLELNASDVRNTEAIKNTATRGAITETFNSDGEFLSSKKGGRKLIILDEADNIFGREDFGGLHTIVETIRLTRQPIILIVNDYYEITRRSSAIQTLCEPVRFQAIRWDAMNTILRKVCDLEDISISRTALDYIISRAGGDLRAALNDLQTLCEGKRTVTDEAVKALGQRDIHENMFNLVGEILRGSNPQRSRELVQNLNEPPETLMLWLDENLPYEYLDTADLRDGYQTLSRADVFLGRVERLKYYGLWSYALALMSSGMTISKKKRYMLKRQPSFPSWLRKMSASKALRAVQNTVCQKIAHLCHTSKAVARQEYLPYLRHLFLTNREFRLQFAADLNLTEEEVGFLLGEKPDSHPVQHVVEQAQKLKSGISVKSEEKGAERQKTQKKLLEF